MEEIDKIVQINITRFGVGGTSNQTDEAKDFLRQILDLDDKLHIHLNETMPSDNYW